MAKLLYFSKVFLTILSIQSFFFSWLAQGYSTMKDLNLRVLAGMENFSIGVQKKPPGFYLSEKFHVHRPLQQCLNRIIKGLGGEEALGPNMGLALADLTNGKINRPEFSQYNSLQSIYGASISKVSALVTAHQMRFDFRNFVGQFPSYKEKRAFREFRARYGKPRKGMDLEKIFSFGRKMRNGPRKVDFSPYFKEILGKMIRKSHNESANKVIQHLGFDYIYSGLIFLGLYNPKQGGGLWLGRGFTKKGRTWGRDPLNNLSHSANVLSLTRMFTLMAQGKLISQIESKSIKSYLANSSFNNKFILGFRRAGLFVNQHMRKTKDPLKRVKVWRKTGTYLKFSHDSMLVERPFCFKKKSCKGIQKLRYVAVAMTKGKPGYGSLKKIIKKLDQCIVNNNLHQMARM